MREQKPGSETANYARGHNDGTRKGDGGWKTISLSGTVSVSCEVVALGSPGTNISIPRRVGMRKEAVAVVMHEGVVEGDVRVHVYTANIKDILHDFSRDYGSYSVVLRHGANDGGPQIVGSVLSLVSNEASPAIQLLADRDIAGTFEASLFLVELPHGIQTTWDSAPKNHTRGGPLSRLNDFDSEYEMVNNNDDAVSVTSERSTGSASGTRKQKSTGSVKKGKDKRDFMQSANSKQTAGSGPELAIVGSSVASSKPSTATSKPPIAPAAPESGKKADDPFSTKGTPEGQAVFEHIATTGGSRRGSAIHPNSVLPVMHSQNQFLSPSMFESKTQVQIPQAQTNSLPTVNDEEMGGGTRSINLDDSDDDGNDQEGPQKTRALPKSEFRTAQRFTANRAWAGAIVAPTNANDVVPKADLPAQTLELEHVYGYRTRDVRNNLFYITPTSILYPAGCVGVIHDLRENKQRFFQGRHKEDVVCVCPHPSLKLVATGDIVCHDDGCFVYLWDPFAPEDTKRQIQIRIGEKKLARGVADVEFSPDGRWLIVVAMDADHMVYVYDWQRKTEPFAKEKGHTDSIFGTTFNPASNTEFVTFGIKHLRYWTLNPKDGTLKGERGIFGSRKVQSILCAAFLANGSYVTGSHGGELLIWSRNQVITSIDNAHQGPVFAVLVNKFGILSGGKDGKLILRDATKFKTVEECEVESGVRSLCYAPDDPSKVLVGLEDSTIVEVSGIGGGKNQQTRLLEAHSAQKDEELWGCATCPTRDWEVVTCGDDERAFKWDLRSRRKVGSANVPGKCRAATYSPDGSYIAIGNDKGDIYILYAEDMRQAFIQKYVKRKGVATNKHGVEVVRFSPNGQYLGVGGHDLVVDLYDVPSGLKYIGSCKGHSSYITQMDFSLDSAFIQTNSADYELLFWSIPSCKQITSASAMKDVAWETYTCVLGWPVQGIWEKGMDGTDINAADRSPDQTFLVSGDDFNNVRLHVYPASKAGLPCKKFRAHSSHVTETEVTCSNSHVLSTGGLDGCLMQWRVKME